MQRVLGSMLALCLVGFVLAAKKGEPCEADTQCNDSGLFCTGGFCKCYSDFAVTAEGKNAFDRWSCNNVKDCDEISSKILNSKSAESRRRSRQTSCEKSNDCPAFSAEKSKYCVVDLDS